MSEPITIEGKPPLHTETFTFPDDPTIKDALKLMDLVSKFLTKAAVTLLTEKKGTFPAIHPAPAHLLQAASTLQNGCANLEMIIHQQGQQGFVAPGAQRGLTRMN